MPFATLTLDTRVVVSRDQLSTSLSGEAVILGMRDAVYYGLDAVGARVWQLMQSPSSLREIAGKVAQEYEVTPDRALADIEALAKDLLARGLIEVVAAPAS